MGGGGGVAKIDIANQQENHSQDKYFPQEITKKGTSPNKYISPFSNFPTQQETLAEHILPLRVPGTCWKFLDPLFLGFFHQSIIDWC